MQIKPFKLFSTLALASVLVVSAFGPTAMAAGLTADVPTSVEVIGGTLDLTADTTPIAFDNIELNALVAADYNSVRAIPAFNVTDARGSDVAWDLQASATQFSDGVTLEVLPGDILSIDNTLLTSSEAVLTLANAKSVLTGTGQSVVTALGGDGSGMGSFDFSGSNLVIDALTADFAQYKAGSYASTVNLSLVTTP